MTYSNSYHELIANSTLLCYNCYINKKFLNYISYFIDSIIYLCFKRKQKPKAEFSKEDKHIAVYIKM